MDNGTKAESVKWHDDKVCVGRGILMPGSELVI